MMGINEIRLLEENSLSPIKRLQEQNMQTFFFHFLPGIMSGGLHVKSK